MAIRIIFCNKCWFLVGYYWIPRMQWFYIIPEIKESNLIGCKNCGSYYNQDHNDGKTGTFKMFFTGEVTLLDLKKIVKCEYKISKGIIRRIKSKLLLDNL